MRSERQSSYLAARRLHRAATTVLATTWVLSTLGVVFGLVFAIAHYDEVSQALALWVMGASVVLLLAAMLPCFLVQTFARYVMFRASPEPDAN